LKMFKILGFSYFCIKVKHSILRSYINWRFFVVAALLIKPKQKHFFVYKLYGFCCYVYQNKQKIKSSFFFSYADHLCKIIKIGHTWITWRDAPAHFSAKHMFSFYFIGAKYNLYCKNRRLIGFHDKPYFTARSSKDFLKQ
jgi:hypothetical protein